MVYFPAILEAGARGSYGVFFPDLPGCTSGGESQDEAVRNATEALLLHLEGMIEDQAPIPEPSRLETLPRDPDVAEVGRFLVPAGPFKPERINSASTG